MKRLTKKEKQLIICRLKGHVVKIPLDGKSELFTELICMTCFYGNGLQDLNKNQQELSKALNAGPIPRHINARSIILGIQKYEKPLKK